MGKGNAGYGVLCVCLSACGGQELMNFRFCFYRKLPDWRRYKQIWKRKLETWASVLGLKLLELRKKYCRSICILVGIAETSF